MDEIRLVVDKNAIANRIRARRNECGLTQNELGMLLGIEQGKVSRYENAGGVPNAEFLMKLAIALNVSVDWLLGLSEEKERH